MFQPSDSLMTREGSSSGDTLLTCSELVRGLSKYVQNSAELMYGTRERSDAENRTSLLFGTLASTRLRAKHALDALDRPSEDSSAGDGRFDSEGILPFLREFDFGLDQQLSDDEIWQQISSTDEHIQKAIEQMLEFEPDREEQLGQVLTIFSMMRRACSYVIGAEFQTG
jgi:hypothetical protein